MSGERKAIISTDVRRILSTRDLIRMNKMESKRLSDPQIEREQKKLQ